MNTLENFKVFIVTQNGTFEESLTIDEFSDLISDKNNWDYIIRELLKFHKQWVDGNTLKLKNVLTRIYKIAGIEFIIEYINFRNTEIESFDDLGGYFDYFEQVLSPNEWNLFSEGVKRYLIKRSFTYGVHQNKNPLSELTDRLYYDMKEGRVIDSELLNKISSYPVKFSYRVLPSVYLFRAMIKEAHDEKYLKIFDELLAKYID